MSMLAYDGVVTKPHLKHLGATSQFFATCEMKPKPNCLIAIA